MSNSTSPLPESPYIALARKMLLLILLMVVTAIGLVILLLQVKVASPILMLILTGAVIGLVAGFSVRRVLGRRTVMLRISSILAFIVGGLSLLGWFTGWRVGIGPLKIGRANVDWLGLWQFLLGTGIALLTLYAWRRRPKQATAPAPKPKRARSSARTGSQPEKRSRRAGRPQVAAASAVATQPVKSQRKRITRRKPQLQLSKEEEHRCPYCLELIEPNDPRGTVECKICHTLHHADCWAITGACQVPHYTV